MGMTRKIMSVLTFGLIDDRSDEERATRSAPKTAKKAKAQTNLMRQQAQQERDRDRARAAESVRPPLRN